MNNLFLLVVVTTSLATFGTVSCRSDKKFASKATSTDAAPEAIQDDGNAIVTESKPTAGLPTGAPVAACDKSAVGITQAKLLSNGISTNLGTQTLRYELAVLNCKDGSVESLKDQPVLFDLDASLAQGFQPIAYALLDSTSTPISNATLEVVLGSDLFGNTGNYAHWTTKSFSYTSKLEKLILEIKLDNIQIQVRDPAATNINSYLRIGSAQAVTQPLPIVN